MSSVEILSGTKSAEFTEQWYEFATDSHFWMRWRHHALLGFFRDLDLSTEDALCALDVGTGNGTAPRQIEADTAWVVDGVDLNEAGLRQGQEGRGRRYHYDILERSPSLLHRYDLIFLFDVIEHLEDTKPFLQAAAAHLKPGGLLIVNVPALQTLFSEYDRQVGHFRRYNKKTLRGALREAGLVPTLARYWGATLVPVLAARKLYLAAQKDHARTVEKGFQPPAPWINEAFSLLGRFETSWFPPFPLGSSLLFAAQIPSVQPPKEEQP